MLISLKPQIVFHHGLGPYLKKSVRLPLSRHGGASAAYGLDSPPAVHKRALDNLQRIYASIANAAKSYDHGCIIGAGLCRIPPNLP